MPDFHRKPTRLRDYDYADPGSYFVTICLAERRPLFGDVSVSGEVVRTACGNMVDAAWNRLPQQFEDVALDAMIVMPDHLHGIIVLGIDPASDKRSSLNDVIGWFKTITTNRYTDGVRRDGWPPYEGRLWQRSYYDRIVRNDADLRRCRTYIEGNPARWIAKQDSL